MKILFLALWLQTDRLIFDRMIVEPEDLMKTDILVVLACLVLAVGIISYRHRERPKPPCKLQMDKTKPNYNDCGAFTPIKGIDYEMPKEVKK